MPIEGEYVTDSMSMHRIKRGALFAFSAFLLFSIGSGFYFWIYHWSSPATASLTNTLAGVTEVQVRVSCMEAHSSKRIVFKIQGAK